ncbi:MAG: SDR family oxidoreductase [Acidimicrobiales bacterium]|nr:SDR family oxidoreductase [Acidimicrobiales bacterium]MDG1845865.1 SDR family oxidoreductase [Acidimicrobiales bacterium]
MTSKRIVITGASRGIGLEMAKILIGKGHSVYGAVRNPDGANDLREAGPTGILQLDIGDQSSIDAFGQELASITDGIDILVNNAGITSNDLGVNRRQCNPWEIDPAIVLEETQINALGPMMVTRNVISLLEAGNNPVVLNTSSQLGSMVIGAMMPSDVAYNVSKAAVNMITVMSASTNKNVAFVALHPGWVKTDMGTDAAEMEVSDSAGAIVDSLLSLTIEDSGRFIRWDGTDHPW